MLLTMDLGHRLRYACAEGTDVKEKLLMVGILECQYISALTYGTFYIEQLFYSGFVPFHFLATGSLFPFGVLRHIFEGSTIWSKKWMRHGLPCSCIKQNIDSGD